MEWSYFQSVQFYLFYKPLKLLNIFSPDSLFLVFVQLNLIYGGSWQVLESRKKKKASPSVSLICFPFLTCAAPVFLQHIFVVLAKKTGLEPQWVRDTIFWRTIEKESPDKSIFLWFPEPVEGSNTVNTRSTQEMKKCLHTSFGSLFNDYCCADLRWQTRKGCEHNSVAGALTSRLEPWRDRDRLRDAEAFDASRARGVCRFMSQEKAT